MRRMSFHSFLVNMSNLKKVFNNSRVLITGHTGFKGSWLSVWLKSLGASLIGVSDKVSSEPSHYSQISSVFDIDLRVDIRDLEKLNEIILSSKPNFIFHLAAQSLVIDSYLNPYQTFMTNTFGTINLLESLRNYQKNCNVVIITSDKSYENLELDRGYHEDDKIGGYDPYSGSKGAAELGIRSYFHSFFSKGHPVKMAIARAGNVVGGGDWSKGRIVPDIIQSWQASKPLILRNPKSTRPWQHVLEPLHGYLLLAMHLENNNPSVNGEAFNFGPAENYNHNVLEVVSTLARLLPEFSWEHSPKNLEGLYESKLLSLNSKKALKYLNWSPKLTFDEIFLLTADWYKSFYSSDQSNILDMTQEQITNYSKNYEY